MQQMEGLTVALAKQKRMTDFCDATIACCLPSP